MCRLHSTCPLHSGWDCGALGTGLCAAAAAPPRTRRTFLYLTHEKRAQLALFKMVVFHLLAASFVLPQHGWITPARRTLSAVCQASTPDVPGGGGEQGDPRGPRPADHRRKTISSQASQAVEQHVKVPPWQRPSSAHVPP